MGTEIDSRVVGSTPLEKQVAATGNWDPGMAGFMAVGADDGHLSECAIFAIKKTNGTYVWPEARGPPPPERTGSGKAAGGGRPVGGACDVR